MFQPCIRDRGAGVNLPRGSLTRTPCVNGEWLYRLSTENNDGLPGLQPAVIYRLHCITVPLTVLQVTSYLMAPRLCLYTRHRFSSLSVNSEPQCLCVSPSPKKFLAGTSLIP